ncbi:MAG: hypothetical protein M1818_005558 [Claussenomyces sp. TS43310]|nr:MAG: hypothetical protein M1818_005558 [Claussenomyces sp. TS43310]
MTTSYPAIPADLQDLIREKFEAAKSSKALTYYPTEVAILKIHGIPFQLRFSPALAHKPTTTTTRHQGGDTKRGDGDGEHDDAAVASDPFAKPAAELLICDLPPSHRLVLNKFAVVPEHFILATRAFAEQTHLLTEGDLAAVHALVRAWAGVAAREELFAFYNSGPGSGASQRHRHVQFLPVERMREGLGHEADWEVLLDGLTEASTPRLPFAYFVAAMPPDPSPAQLSAIYRDLYERACRAVTAWSAANAPTEPLVRSDDVAAISYNLGVTNRAMILCPRRAGGFEISGGEHGRERAVVELNGTMLAGTLLVKHEMEWDALRNDERQFAELLEAVGIPSSFTGTGIV